MGVAQVALDEPRIAPRFEQMGGVGRPEGMDGHAGFGHAGPVCGGAKGALDTGATHGRGGGRALFVITAGGGKEPGLVAMGFPGGSQQSEGLLGQGDGAVLSPLAPVDMDLEALAIDIRDLEGEGCMEPESQAVDGGAGDLVVQRCRRFEETPDFFNTEDSREAGGGLSAKERESVPIALEDVLGEKSDATGAEAHGSGGEAIDVFAVQEVVLQLLCGE